MKILSSGLLLSLSLFVAAPAMAVVVGVGKTARTAVRAELKQVYPKTKFGPIALTLSGIANELKFKTLAKVKMGQFPIQATGVVSDKPGGWRAQLDLATGNTGITGGIGGINNQVP